MKKGEKWSDERRLIMLTIMRNPEYKTRVNEAIKNSWTEERKVGHIEKRKGKKHTEDHCRKISTGNKGKIRTNEMKQRYSELNMGKRTGIENNLWKGGVSRSYKTGYYSPEYIRWRKNVFERDNYTCQDCGIHDGRYLTAHHIKSFAHFPELRFEINNGKTLCEDCHSKTDNYRGRNKNKILNN